MTSQYRPVTYLLAEFATLALHVAQRRVTVTYHSNLQATRDPSHQVLKGRPKVGLTSCLYSRMHQVLHHANAARTWFAIWMHGAKAAKQQKQPLATSCVLCCASGCTRTNWVLVFHTRDPSWFLVSGGRILLYCVLCDYVTYL